MAVSAGDRQDEPHTMLDFATELGPLIIFHVVNMKFRLITATAAFMVVTVLAGIASLMVKGHMPITSLITSVGVLAFGTLTLVLDDDTFIKVEATVVSGLLSTLLGGGLLFGRSFIVVTLDRIFNLTTQGWRILTFRWAMFFAGIAILNEVIWRTQTTDAWVNFRTLGVTTLSLLLGYILMPLTERYYAGAGSPSVQSSFVQVRRRLPESEFRGDVEGGPVEQEPIDRRGERCD
ncbi:intracellular septation protein [Bradyrhizobium macuxiense]|uniref:Inner membrane-spanning protein YciB n=1 Tax=Bradyrhizobium macuxiense TaxID=1755647 RepID=A0A560L251_9BRAD|nr:intracellular septation protein [Bradyrhizobium macuxiense]